MYTSIGQAPVLPPEGLPPEPGPRPQPGTKGLAVPSSGWLSTVPPLYLALGVSVGASLLLTGLLWAIPSRKKKKKTAKKAK